MQTALAIALALSALVNVALFVRNFIWKTRANGVMDAVQETNKRLMTTFELLWREAQAKGETDKQIFTQKIIALAEVPAELREFAIEKMGLMPKASSKSIGFQG